MRIEDVDQPRTRAGAETAILTALERYGFQWDGAIVRQSERTELYAAALARLVAAGDAFECACSRRELEAAGDAAAVRAAKIEEYREKFANPYVAAQRGFIDEVILPRQTRGKRLGAPAALETKRDRKPPKKHGNIPL